MRSISLFLTGIVVGSLVQIAIAQNGSGGILGLNHVGIAVPDLDAAIGYYTETMGFPEAFRVVNDAGETGLVYVQISRNTFIELQRANDNRPPGLTHLGIEVENMDAATQMYGERGASVSEPRSGSTNAILANVTDLNGVRIELSEYPAGSLQREAIDNWQ